MGGPLRAGKKGKAISTETLSDCIQVGVTDVVTGVCMLARTSRYCSVDDEQL